MPKGSLQLHHLRCTFGYPCGLKYPHYAKFDVRPEACLKVANFVPGDIVTSSQAMGVRSTCIGLKYNSQANKAKWKQSQVLHACKYSCCTRPTLPQLWYHVTWDRSTCGSTM